MPLTERLVATFSEAMRGFGPFEPSPSLAVAVSGGADSMALALLTRDWAVAISASVRALIVDHGLRSESAREAAQTAERLGALGITACILRLANLSLGPAMAERARTARYAALSQFCHGAGILHLLLGHHAADQQETLAMRVLRSSYSSGLAGMAAIRERHTLRLLRPLLTVTPAELRTFLRNRGIDWVEDPSNRDLRALRPRLRAALPPPEPALSAVLTRAGHHRSRQEVATAEILVRRVTFHPEGFALLDFGRIDVNALRSLLRTISGAAYATSSTNLVDLAADPRPITIGGVRLLPAGRLGPGLLLVREEAAIAPLMRLKPGLVWDGRFRITGLEPSPKSPFYIGKLGAAAAKFRKVSHLPSAILRTLPALWLDETLSAVPHLGYGTDKLAPVRVLFTPPNPLCGPDFRPSESSEL